MQNQSGILQNDVYQPTKLYPSYFTWVCMTWHIESKKCILVPVDRVISMFFGYQAITWTNMDPRKNFIENVIKLQNSSNKKIHIKSRLLNGGHFYSPSIWQEADSALPASNHIFQSPNLIYTISALRRQLTNPIRPITISANCGINGEFFLGYGPGNVIVDCCYLTKRIFIEINVLICVFVSSFIQYIPHR